MLSKHAATILAAIAMLTACAWRADTYDFESDTIGKIASGFTLETAQWAVIDDPDNTGNNKVFAQLGATGRYNLVLLRGKKYKDVDIRVKIRHVSGKADQGGGIVWRAVDNKNYYVCRYNPISKNYKIDVRINVDNNRSKLGGTKNINLDLKWHEMRVTMKGSTITAYFDGKQFLQMDNTNYPNAGYVGLWTKEDARSSFDDLVITDLSAGGGN